MKQPDYSTFKKNLTFCFKKLLFCFVLATFANSGKVNAQSVQGFFLNDWNPKRLEMPVYIETEKPAAPAEVTVLVHYNDTLAKVSPYIFGNNANTYSTIMYDNSKLVNYIKDLNPGVLRYPGGNLSNEFFWDLPADTRPDDIPANVNVWDGMNQQTWTMSVNNYYKFLETIGAEGIITVNYSYARYGLSDDPVAQAAHYAADWVRYDNGRTKFWEIGNENFGNWQQGYKIDTSLNKDGQPETINGELYGQHCRVFIDSMKAAAAEAGNTIYIGVQAWESETSWDPVQTVWNEKMMPVIADKADFYIVHNYYTPYNEDSDAHTILETYDKSNEFKSAVLADLQEAGFGPAPIALTEWNIFAVGSKQQVSHINGIHAVLVTGELIKDEYGLATRWNLANGWNNGDDHGTFSQGNEPGVPRFEPRPVFYYLTYFQRYFGDVLLKNSVSGSNDIVAFSSSFENGPVGLVVVNKGTTDKTIQIETNGFTSGSRFYWYSLEGGDLDGEFSRQVVINDHAPSLVAGGPLDYNDVAANSAETADGILISAKPYSVNYVLLEGTKTGMSELKNPKNEVFKIHQNYPNPFTKTTQINYSLKKNGYVKIGVYNMDGQLIRTLENSVKEPNSYRTEWNGKNQNGESVSGGIYLYRFDVQTDDGYFTETKYMSLLR